MPAAAAVALPAARRHARSTLQTKKKPPGDGDEGDGVHHKPRSASHPVSRKRTEEGRFGPSSVSRRKPKKAARACVLASVQLAHLRRSADLHIISNCPLRNHRSSHATHDVTIVSREQGRPRAHILSTFIHPSAVDCALSHLSHGTIHRRVVWTLVTAAHPLVCQPPPTQIASHRQRASGSARLSAPAAPAAGGDFSS